MNSTSERLKMFVVAAMFAAITGILAQMVIPLPLVPITGQTLAVGLTATILGSRYGTLAMILYAIMGAIGLPVFTEASGGFHVILGKTGGYIIGFIFTAFVTGIILEKTRFSFLYAMLANTAGMVVTLVFGVVQLKYVLDAPWDKALEWGVYPFIVVGLIKAALASFIGVKVRERLIAARLLKEEVPKSA
ncbi:biotin transporter BioY [Brevibacillus massiliensis]|uniref:biotin transporter BioY n=1 Tax=Brevibacillus massiliensis TaxID=1118054 RepID=UPI0002EF24D2|nr:biotin transporter BioY [Brevibacillus massiliensis]